MIESLEDLSRAFDGVAGVTATLHRADDSDLPGGNDTVTVECDTVVDFESTVTGPLSASRLYVFATEVFDDGSAEVTVNDPNDLEWVSA